jgi:hypothetical protein
MPQILMTVVASLFLLLGATLAYMTVVFWQEWRR